MTPRAAAQLLGVRLDSIYPLIWAGKLAAQKVDGRWRIPSHAVEQRLKQNTYRSVIQQPVVLTQEEFDGLQRDRRRLKRIIARSKQERKHS
jgi:excisionase family DNA binding protein